MALPGAVLHDPRWQIFDANGVPLAGAKLYAFATGTVTPLSLYTNAALTVAHAHPVVADADGRFAAMFMLPQGYDLAAKTSADVAVWSITNYASPFSFLANLGDELAVGNKNQTSGYTVLSTDNFVSISVTGGASPVIVNLQAATARGLPLVVENRTAVAMAVTPNGSDTIDGVAGAYTVPLAASPLFPKVVLLPVTGGYVIFASHGI